MNDISDKLVAAVIAILVAILALGVFVSIQFSDSKPTQTKVRNPPTTHSTPVYKRTGNYKPPRLPSNHLGIFSKGDKIEMMLEPNQVIMFVVKGGCAYSYQWDSLAVQTDKSHTFVTVT